MAILVTVVWRLSFSSAGLKGNEQNISTIVGALYFDTSRICVSQHYALLRIAGVHLVCRAEGASSHLRTHLWMLVACKVGSNKSRTSQGKAKTLPGVSMTRDPGRLLSLSHVSQ